MKRIATVIGILVCSCIAQAQQELQISQYMFNGLYLNPAYAGTHPFWGGTAIHRQQWLGFGGNPVSTAVAFDGPIKDKNMGLGFMVINDNIGLTSNNDISAAYSYRIKVNENSQLSFGLRAGIRNIMFNATKLENIPDAGDPLYNANQSIWVPKFDFGAYWYSERGYLGLSVPNLLAIDSRTSDNSDAGLRRHVFLNGGYVWDIVADGSVKFKPSVLVKYEPNSPVSFDLNAHFLFNDKFWLGASYRYNSAVVLMAEYQITEQFRAGFAFDATTSDIRQYQNGTIEFMLGYDFTQKLVKIKHPRYF
jgi:type IX secretion system PorP/SprF family membrane protein